MYNESYERLNLFRNHWANEEEVRRGWLREIESILNINFHNERGHTDADYNQVIIEFKDKGLFHGRTDSPKFREAIFDRLARYIPEKARRDGISIVHYVGIAIDGDSIAFAYFPSTVSEIVHGPIMPLSSASVSLVMDICNHSTRRAMTDSNLIEDFGHTSEIGLSFMRLFSKILVDNINCLENNKIKMLFYEWKTLYGQVADLSEPQIRAIQQTIGFSCDTLYESDRFSSILFIIHSYNSLIIKLLAAEIISKITTLSAYSDFAQYAATLNNDELINSLDQDIEHAKFFSQANIAGFIEEPLFSWYIDAYESQGTENKDKIANAIREILIRLASYQLGDLSHAQTNDVLKLFYQNLVPETLRKSLGEFYTPDWLVEVTLDKLEGRFYEKRFLDPTCGSASFLLGIIKRIRLECSAFQPRDILTRIVNNVWGFDLNPLAVQTARVNYLIAISDLISSNLGEKIEIPILLADAIYSPAPEPGDHQDIVTYTIGSQIADLSITIPTELAQNRKWLDQIFQSMGDSVEINLEPKEAVRALLDNNIINLDTYEKWATVLESTYSHVLSLHRRHWNGIWFRIVRNYFWSSTAGVFDVIIGNPPWVRWSKLPALYEVYPMSSTKFA
ncbi:MAG: N-6 DNA methylase [Bacilli bacterium]|nr:N-6 DNA methylase [Bacilli bacterium]